MLSGAKLYAASEHDGKNIVFSPRPIHMGLNWLLMGAKPKNETEQQLHKALGLYNMDLSIVKFRKLYDKLIEKIRELAGGRTKNIGDERVVGKEAPVIDSWSTAILKDIELNSNFESIIKEH